MVCVDGAGRVERVGGLEGTACLGCPPDCAEKLPDLVLHSVARKSIPQYDVGHRVRAAAARAAAAAVFGGRLVLVGNSLGGVGAADAIAGALAGANEALRKVLSAAP